MPKGEKMDFHCKMIMEEYRENLPVFKKIREIVIEQLQDIASCGEIKVDINTLESRIKTEKSLAGKLELKGYKYNTLADITDIVGARIVTIYADNVDAFAEVIEKRFTVDWENSVDKRATLDPDQFGYMSLHYICSIPKNMYDDPAMPNVNLYRFEIQVRSTLQHVWAVINHDTGYKTDVEVPKKFIRSLNALAGLLEIADTSFSKLRDDIEEYRQDVYDKVQRKDFAELPMDTITFKGYLETKPFEALTRRIAEINHMEITETNLLSYVKVMKKIGIKSIGDVDKMIRECSDMAFAVAEKQIQGTDIDIISDSLALRNLCAAYVVSNGGGEDGLTAFYDALKKWSGNRNLAKKTISILENKKA